MDKFRWAYLGCGDIAQITAKELFDGEIVAVRNRTSERAQEFAGKFGGVVYATAEDAINAPGVEGVYIAVTANLHADYMKLCIQHHKPVLCEKPFTVNSEQAKEIFDYARQENVYVSEAMWTWHNATAQQVKSWIHSDAVGKIKEVNCTYSFPMIKFSKKPRHFQAELIAGALLDIGVYCIRYCYELFGMPQKILCEGRLKDGFDLGEHITLFYDDFQANLIISRDQNHGEKFVVIGDKGTISVPMFHMAKKAVLKNPKTQKFQDKRDLYGVQFSNVAKEIRSGNSESHIISAQSTIDCLSILDICREQMGLIYPCEIL